MIGIYLLKNEINGKVYIGQSTDINRRYSEHLRSAQPEKYSSKNDRDKKTPIHLAMSKYGITNFSLKILEECERELLDEKEIKWIDFYSSNIADKGYNLTNGGQLFEAKKGESHTQAKLSQQEVNSIKSLLRESGLSLSEINELFPQISKSTISMINQGKIWIVETEKYPLREISCGLAGEKNKRAKFTDSEVIEMRTKHSQGVSFSEICEIYKQKSSVSAIRKIIYGESYKHLPIWKSSLKKWI